MAKGCSGHRTGANYMVREKSDWYRGAGYAEGINRHLDQLRKLGLLNVVVSSGKYNRFKVCWMKWIKDTGRKFEPLY